MPGSFFASLVDKGNTAPKTKTWRIDCIGPIYATREACSQQRAHRRALTLVAARLMGKNRE